MGVRLQTSLNNGLNNGLRQSISGGVVSLAFLEYTTASVSSFQVKSQGTVNYDVDWGDGSTETGITSNAKDHTYSTADVYKIKITPAEGSTFRPEHYNATNFATNLTKVDGTGGSSLGTDLTQWLRDTTSLTSFGSSINTSSVTVFQTAWRGCSSLTSFPSLNVSSGSLFQDTWNGCTGLTSFPALDMSSGTDFRGAWFGCTSLTSFPSITPTSGTDFGGAWRNCTSLATYPANQFDNTGTLASGAFSLAFVNCALTAQSIENILTSLDTNGSQNITLQIGGGTNAGKSTWSTAANTAYDNLITKGWTINFNS